MRDTTRATRERIRSNRREGVSLPELVKMFADEESAERWSSGLCGAASATDPSAADWTRTASRAGTRTRSTAATASGTLSMNRHGHGAQQGDVAAMGMAVYLMTTSPKVVFALKEPPVSCRGLPVSPRRFRCRVLRGVRRRCRSGLAALPTNCARQAQVTPDLCDADLHRSQAAIKAVHPGGQAVVKAVDPLVDVVESRVHVRVHVVDPLVDAVDAGVDVRARRGRGRHDHGTEADRGREHRACDGDGSTVEPCRKPLCCCLFVLHRSNLPDSEWWTPA